MGLTYRHHKNGLLPVAPNYLEEVNHSPSHHHRRRRDHLLSRPRIRERRKTEADVGSRHVERWSLHLHFPQMAYQ